MDVEIELKLTKQLTKCAITFYRNTENSIISEIPKTVKLLIQKFTKWYILVSWLVI